MTIAAGTKLGRYEIRSKVGEGGRGEVYLTRDTQLDRAIALKILTAEVARDQRNVCIGFAQAALLRVHSTHYRPVGHSRLTNTRRFSSAKVIEKTVALA
jgi:serine/threonine protein kinase